jgi:hypothetical protein
MQTLALHLPRYELFLNAAEEKTQFGEHRGCPADVDGVELAAPESTFALIDRKSQRTPLCAVTISDSALLHARMTQDCCILPIIAMCTRT